MECIAENFTFSYPSTSHLKNKRKYFAQRFKFEKIHFLECQVVPSRTCVLWSVKAKSALHYQFSKMWTSRVCLISSKIGLLCLDTIEKQKSACDDPYLVCVMKHRSAYEFTWWATIHMILGRACSDLLTKGGDVWSSAQLFLDFQKTQNEHDRQKHHRMSLSSRWLGWSGSITGPITRRLF